MHKLLKIDEKVTFLGFLIIGCFCMIESKTDHRNVFIKSKSIHRRQKRDMIIIVKNHKKKTLNKTAEIIRLFHIFV